MPRIALLSNVNVDPIAKMLARRGHEVWKPDGYGDVFGPLMNPASGFMEFAPDATFVVVDTCALLADCYDAAECRAATESWFDAAERILPRDAPAYVSTASCRKEPYCADRKLDATTDVETGWNTKLAQLVNGRANVYSFPLGSLASEFGRQRFYSEKLWYLARMPHTSVAQEAIAVEVARLAAKPVGKKVLALDLDNTLWGGVVGELGPEGIDVSDEREGLVFKDVQREIKRCARAGVILAVVSKNNPEDAKEAFERNRHMALREGDFSIMRVNWERKDVNIADIARTLNVGADSIVFLDDNPTERALVEASLPEVSVVAFPDDVSALPAAVRGAYADLFRRQALTVEDREKGAQYAAFAKRAEMESSFSSFDDYLMELDISAHLVDPAENLQRIAQLIGKTNQFNLTTIRYTQEEVESMIGSSEFLVRAWEVSDRFGNNGITAVAIARLGEVPKIDTFILSCRIMGKRIEDFVIDEVETELFGLGHVSVEAEYRPTRKNVPVRDLYDRLGYERVSEGEDGNVRYRLDLRIKPVREHHVKKA